MPAKTSTKTSVRVKNGFVHLTRLYKIGEGQNAEVKKQKFQQRIADVSNFRASNTMGKSNGHRTTITLVYGEKVYLAEKLTDLERFFGVA